MNSWIRSGPREPAEGRPFAIDLFEAVIFDMDGVLTDTARVHSLCWKQVFDNLLRIRSDDTGEVFVPFDEEDYLRFVDGKPRYDGVESFLYREESASSEGIPRTRRASPPYAPSGISRTASSSELSRRMGSHCSSRRPHSFGPSGHTDSAQH